MWNVHDVEKVHTSPARRIDTPHILPSKPTPWYVAPYVCGCDRAVFRKKKWQWNGRMRTYGGSFYSLWNNREVIETLFDEEADDTVGIEEEVAPRCVFISDDGVESL